MQRTAPPWFIRKLKAIDPCLDVEWRENLGPDKLGRWMVGERLRWSVFTGFGPDGSPVYHVRSRLVRVIFAEELGSRVLDWLRRLRINRFDTVDQMDDELDMEGTGKHDARVANLAV